MLYRVQQVSFCQNVCFKPWFSWCVSWPERNHAKQSLFSHTKHRGEDSCGESLLQSQDLWHLTHPVYNLYIYCCGHTFSIIHFQTGLHMKSYAYPRITFGSRKTDIRFFLVKRKTLCLCCFSSLCPLSINIYLVILLLCLGTSV